MKSLKVFTILILVISSCITITYAQTRFNPKPVSPRVRKIDATAKRVLFQDGKVDFEIIVPPKSCGVVVFAANELANLLGESLGVELKVHNKREGKGVAIRVGDKAFAAANSLDAAGLDRDGYFIKTIGDDIIILGCDSTDISMPLKHGNNNFERATLFGVYDFLETCVGTRFYFPGEIGTVCPKLSRWEVPALDIVERPDNQYRRTYVTHQFRKGKAEWYDDGDQTTAEKLAWFRYRLNTQDIPNCHGLAFLGLVNRFAKTHPEYFALRENGKRHDGSVVSAPSDKDGQICYSSEGLKNEIFLDAKAFLTGQSAESRGIIMNDGKSYWSPSRFPKGPFFNIMPNDSDYPCQCPQCKPHFDAGPQEASNYIWKFKTDIAKRMIKENLNGYATMMAYSRYKLIPDCDIPQNVLVMLALNGPWSEGLSEKRTKDEALLRAWNDKLGAKTYLWTYPSKYGARIKHVPNYAPHAIGNFYKRQAPFIFGAFMEAETDCWIFGALNYYVFSKVMWNTETDVDATISEFFNLMFGKAAPQMATFFNSLESHWMKDILTKVVETTAGPVTVIPSDFEIWTKIFDTKQIEEYDKLFAEASKAVDGDDKSAARVAFAKAKFLEQLKTGRGDFTTKSGNRDTWTMNATRLTSPITIDGKLDEDSWNQAKPVWLLPALGPDSVEVHTRFKFLFDDDFFYVAAECDEPETDNIIASNRPFDDFDIWRDNDIEIFLNPSCDRKTYYQILVNSLGCVTDIHKMVGTSDRDWNSKAEVKTSVIPGKCWIAEVKIPRASMEPSKEDAIVANFNRGRVITSKKSQYFSWSHFIKAFNDCENYGRVFLKPQPEAMNILKDSNFAAPVKGKRFLGKWFAAQVIHRDEAVFRTNGAATRLDDENDVVGQYLPDLKENTKYKLSFYIKTNEIVGGDVYTIIRFGNRKLVIFPTIHFKGTMPWTRCENEFTTPPDKVGTVEKPYIRLVRSSKATGTAWFDQVELVECP